MSFPLLLRTLVFGWRPHPCNPGWSPLEILNLITFGRLFLQKSSYWQATGGYIYWGVTIPFSTEWNQEVETQTSRPWDAPCRITGSTGLLVLPRPWLQVLWECRLHWWNPHGSVLQLPRTIAKQTKTIFSSLYQRTYNQLGKMKIVKQNIWLREGNLIKLPSTDFQNWVADGVQTIQSRVYRDPSHQLLGIMFILKNITLRKKLEDLIGGKNYIEVNLVWQKKKKNPALMNSWWSNEKFSSSTVKSISTTHP